MMLLMACHWIGCLWMLVQQSLEGNPDRWLDNGIGIPVANRSLGEVFVSLFSLSVMFALN